MAKSEWGSKRICQGCGAKFYDLMKDPILCPGCGAQFDPETTLRTRRAKPAVAVKPVKPVPKEAAEKDDELDTIVEDNDDELLVDEDLDDDDEIADVVVKDEEET